MALTITIPGAVEATIGATAPAVLTIGVGTPGATGPAGAAGPGVPAGGSAGQYLQKIDGTNYNTDWVTLNLTAYAPLASPTFTGDPTAPTPATSDNDTSIATTAFVKAQGYLTSAPVTSVAGRTGAITLSNTDISGLGTMSTASASNYSTTAVADTLYAPIAAGLPTGGTVGQILTKQSGTNFDASFQTLIPGDRYLTSSTTSLTINNANKTLTVGTGLSYTSQQDVVIAYDASNHMHARVTAYNSGTGVMDVDVISHTGTGTYAAWTVNVGGTVPVASIVWGDITGTLGNQTDLATALNSKLELSGGVLNANATIEASTTTQASVFSGTGITAELSANPSENVTVNYTGLQVQNGVGTMSVGPAGLTFPNASAQTVAYPGSTGFLLKADNLTGLADTAVSRTNLGLGTMAVATAADYSTTTVANGLYYPLSGNPSSFLVAADITGKANLASPSFTGNVSISSSTGAALFIEQTGTGNILTLHDQASDTTFVTIDANGKVSTIASDATNGAGFNIAHGVAPTSPVNGDIWTTTGALWYRINGTTMEVVNAGSTQTISGSKTFTNQNLTLGNSTTAGTIAIGTGAVVSGSTRTINIGTASAAGSTNNVNIGGGSGTTNVTLGGNINLSGPITSAINNVSLGTGTGASLYAFGTGATATGLTKAVTIGTGGLAGSTTNITIGSTTGTSTTTLQGITNGVTEAVDTNNTELATTAFVVGQASSTTPAATGTAAVGTSLRYARADHVHVNPLPVGGTASQVLSKVDGTDYNVTWTTASGGGGGTDFQAYTTPGTYTWTKPAGAKWVEIYMFGGGGGGGAGARAAIATQRGGGGGGSGGGFVIARMAASSLAATQTVVVGAGGTAGASVVVDGSGNNGGNGGNTTFSIFTAIGGGFGTGGGTVGGGGALGASRSGYLHGSTISTFTPIGGGGNGQSTTGSNGQTITANQAFSSSGGGGGAGAAAASTVSAAGGAGGSKTVQIATQSGTGATAGGAGGTTAGVSPTAGVSGLGLQGGGTGGGGGAYITATAGQAGGAGASPGGGGGGGSVSDTGFASGAGGAGGDGVAYIITYC